MEIEWVYNRDHCTDKGRYEVTTPDDAMRL
jgi:hypothetical protein